MIEAALAGAADLGTVKAAAANAGGTVAPSDISSSAEYRYHLAGVLTARATAAAAGLRSLPQSTGESSEFTWKTHR